MTHTYDPDKVSVIINGTIITGFDASGVFTYTRSNDIVTAEVGVQRVILGDQGRKDVRRLHRLIGSGRSRRESRLQGLLRFDG